MSSEREMQNIIESMEGLAMSVLGRLERQDPNPEVTEMAMGQKSFDKLLDNLFLSNAWDKVMDDLEDAGFDSVEVQNSLKEYFTYVFKQFFTGQGVGTATVKTYYDYWRAFTAKLKGPEREAPDYSRVNIPWESLFKLILKSEDFAALMYRYGNDPNNPDSVIDIKQASEVAKMGMKVVVKAYFGNGGRVAVRAIGESKTLGEQDDALPLDAGSGASLGGRMGTIDKTDMERILDAMLDSPRAERLLMRAGLDFNTMQRLRETLGPVLKTFFDSIGLDVQGVQIARTAVRSFARGENF